MKMKNAFLCKPSLVGAHLCDIAPLHDQYEVGQVKEANPMGHKDSCLGAQEALEQGFYFWTKYFISQNKK